MDKTEYWQSKYSNKNWSVSESSVSTLAYVNIFASHCEVERGHAG